MVFRIALDIGVWFVIWLVVWRLFYGPLAARRINYVDRPFWTGAYFAAAAALVVWLFRDRMAPFATGMAFAPLAVLVLTMTVQVLVYRMAGSRLTRPDRLIAENPREMFLTLDYRYLASKSVEVVFQQVMIVLLVAVVWERTGSLLATMALFAGVFAVGHLPLLRLFGGQTTRFATIYLVASLVSAVVFPVLIVKVPFGFVYTYAAHTMFFTALALWYWGKGAPAALE